MLSEPTRTLATNGEHSCQLIWKDRARPRARRSLSAPELTLGINGERSFQLTWKK
jgi:hypothetical protein